MYSLYEPVHTQAQTPFMVSTVESFSACLSDVTCGNSFAKRISNKINVMGVMPIRNVSCSGIDRSTR